MGSPPLPMVGTSQALPQRLRPIRKPSQKLGIETPTKEKALKTWSGHLSFPRAAMTPEEDAHKQCEEKAGSGKDKSCGSNGGSPPAQVFP